MYQHFLERIAVTEKKSFRLTHRREKGEQMAQKNGQ